MITPSTIEELLDYWPGHVPFKGKLVSEDGACMCAQGQALHFLGGLTVDELRCLDQDMADKQVAELFGISRGHSVLLRIVNDGRPGAPSCVIRNPEQVLGDQAQTVLAFWRHLDRMTPAAWKEVGKVAWEVDGEAAKKAAWRVAGAAARGAAWRVAWEVAWEVAGAAALATCEIQGGAVMRAENQPFSFLPLFGFADPEAVITASP